ncbi:MAG: hypothetical protein WAV72_26295 [Bradyrhizobium sp.]
MTLQIEIRLNCHVLGRDALSDFFIARAMPELADLFLVASQRGFRIVHELCARPFPDEVEPVCRRKMLSFNDSHVF